eukprot:GHVT01005704.1.p2 GENE.GHVT01005704.1~~GHVT01005704.1.p2  ORF type:complete len:112 (-),score=4.22 GHVT01005704.1:2253-2588(-)
MAPFHLRLLNSKYTSTQQVPSARCRKNTTRNSRSSAKVGFCDSPGPAMTRHLLVASPAGPSMVLNSLIYPRCSATWTHPETAAQQCSQTFGSDDVDNTVHRASAAGTRREK